MQIDADRLPRILGQSAGDFFLKVMDKFLNLRIISIGQAGIMPVDDTEQLVIKVANIQLIPGSCRRNYRYPAILSFLETWTYPAGGKRQRKSWSNP